MADFEMTTFIICALALMVVFLGVVLYVSNNRYDGTLTVTQNEHGSTIAMNIDPSDLIDKDHVKLKIISPHEKQVLI